MNNDALLTLFMFLLTFCTGYATWYIVPIIVLIFGVFLSLSSNEKKNTLGKKLRKLSVLLVITVTIAMVVHFIAPSFAVA